MAGAEGLSPTIAKLRAGSLLVEEEGKEEDGNSEAAIFCITD